MNILKVVVTLVLMVASNQAFSMGKSSSYPDLAPVSSVDLDQYVGKWYEIVRVPQIFEAGCVGVTAEYSVRSDGKIQVVNTCRKHTCDGKLKRASGVARVINSPINSKLKVSFFWPFEGDYWILELDPDYNYAVVGSPDRKSFWILSRTSQLDPGLVSSILSRFEKKGFNFSQLNYTQSCE